MGLEAAQAIYDEMRDKMRAAGYWGAHLAHVCSESQAVLDYVDGLPVMDRVDLSRRFRAAFEAGFENDETPAG